MRRPPGFTLAEMMLTLALVALVYTMISTILIQIARYSNSGRQVAQERLELLKTVEELRYQFRSLYLPPGAPALSGTRTPMEGRDTVRFLTTSGRIHEGVVEAGYKIQEVEDVESSFEQTGSALYYREFPFRRQEFRSLDPHQEAQWKLLLSDVQEFELQYSSTGETWQREWETAQAPAIIRVKLRRGGSPPDEITFDVTPGVGARRW